MRIRLFTDGSVNTQTKIGYGAYLILSDIDSAASVLAENVQVRRFENTSSSKLELQCLLWALGVAQERATEIIAYTDSQNIIGLPKRRARLEAKDYRNSKQERLRHYELYQKFYSTLDQVCCQFIKVRGHSKAAEKDGPDKIFTLVDRAARNALRQDRAL